MSQELPKTYNPKKVEDRTPYQFCKYTFGQSASRNKGWGYSPHADYGNLITYN